MFDKHYKINFGQLLFGLVFLLCGLFGFVFMVLDYKSQPDPILTLIFGLCFSSVFGLCGIYIMSSAFPDVPDRHSQRFPQQLIYPIQQAIEKFVYENQVNGETLFVGVVAVIMGILCVAMSLLGPDEQLNAPRWVAALASSTFIIAGLCVLGSQTFGKIPAKIKEWVGTVTGVTALTFLGIVGAWVSLFGDSEGFSSSINGLPISTPDIIPRIAFGFGALITLFLAGFGWVHIIRGIFQHPKS